jgi:DNA-binding IclR family transcriptional regulator
MKRESNEYTVQAVVNAFDLLEALTDENIKPTAVLLAQKLKISSNKLFRILATLEQKGLIEHDKINGNYRLGMSAFGMAQHIMKSASIIRIAQPIMEELARKHDEAVYLTILNNDEVLFLDMVDSFQHIKAVTLVGKRFPFFTNASGKVIKAMGSSDVLENLGKRRASKIGITDVQVLESELDTIRKQGVAVDNNGLGEGICSVAVAIKDYAGMVIGALTLLAPSFRMLQERVEQEIIPSMLKGSEELSMKFGYAKIHV